MSRTDSTDAPRALLTVEDLSVTFQNGEIVAAEGVSFTVAPGERLAIVGESGSGKSASCSAIGGYVTDVGSAVTASKLDFDGIDLLARTKSRLPKRTPGITMMFQDAMTSLDAVWTVGSQLKAALRANPAVPNATWKKAAVEWLHHVGLTDTDRVLRARPYELSGGMRQRVMLAIALCGAPRLLIADEPTSALDASLSQDVMELMVTLTSETGAALVIISHDIRLCQEYSDRMVVMFRGHQVEEVVSADIVTAAKHPYTRGLMSCVPTLDNYDVEELPTIDRFILAEVKNEEVREDELRVA
ncbi:ABC transporter ATP-binding protein [Microbacteriaceae bacterium VKM Ac-2855]|nr:ABC transporter ATP-binding protein [Microbacteriaceae bacterium VKM Ac-2855]